MDPRIRLETEGPVAVLTLDRPEKLNALDAAMVRGLAEACAALERDESVRCVVLAAVGKAFCAGGDVEAWSALSPRDFARFWVREGHAAFDALARLRQPVIAALAGHAFGGGLELAACADLRIAEPQVKLGQPEAGLGIVPGWSGAQRAVRRFGARAVRRMALFGETLTADEALALGVVDRVVAPGRALAEARALAATVAARGPVATEIVKMMIAAAEGEERERPLDALAGGWSAGTADLAEGVAAFRARRPADFPGA